jgi:hypothetical protein
MAYKVNQPDTPKMWGQGLASLDDLDELRVELARKTPEFYELETAEVIKVYLNEEDFSGVDENDKEFSNWSKYGWARVRMTMSSTDEFDTLELPMLDTNVKEYPLPGEMVTVVDFYSIGQKFYTQKINMTNSINANSDYGRSKYVNQGPGGGLTDHQDVKHFKANINIREIKSEEGDATFNGRFGQSIRFGSNITAVSKSDGTHDEYTEKPISPNVIIRAGQGDTEKIPDGGDWKLDEHAWRPVVEDINLDGSSLWLTTDQRIHLDSIAAKEVAHENTLPTDSIWDGKQIVLNSDRIIFNSKLNSIHVYSDVDVSVAAKERINLEVESQEFNEGKTAVNLGDRKAKSHALTGEPTLQIISDLCKWIIDFGNTLSSAKAAPGIPWQPTALMEANIAGGTLMSSIKKIKKRCDDGEALSRTVFVAHPKKANVGKR